MRKRSTRDIGRKREKFEITNRRRYDDEIHDESAGWPISVDTLQKHSHLFTMIDNEYKKSIDLLSVVFTMPITTITIR